jgi:hypothetical protein
MQQVRDKPEQQREQRDDGDAECDEESGHTHASCSLPTV